MLATVLWLGGLAAINFLILPAAGSQPELRAQALEKALRRLDPAAWFSLIVLIATGLAQMSANPNYEGFLAFTSTWAVSILLKHIVFIGMIALRAYLTWFSLPALRRALLRRSRGQDVPGLARLERSSAGLIRLNLILGVVILVFTAVARAAA